MDMLLNQINSGTSITTTNEETLAEYGLDGVNCDICGNKGQLAYYRNGILYSKPCMCMAKRRSFRRIQRSGMADMFSRYTFDNYKTVDEDRKRIKVMAGKFAMDDSGWFYIAGQSGSGKTHICTAICSALVEGSKDVYYMAWRDESRNLKGLMNTDEVDEPLRKLKKVAVLYIDDFLKGGVSEADIRLAFEIINARYNDSSLRTIISSEMTIEEVLEMDEALGSRIYERSKGYTIKAPNENYRLRSG